MIFPRDVQRRIEWAQIQIKSVKNDRQVILSLIACPYLNVEMQNSQFYHKAVTSPRPIHSGAVDEAEFKGHDVAENKNTKIVCSCSKFEISPFFIYWDTNLIVIKKTLTCKLNAYIHQYWIIKISNK